MGLIPAYAGRTGAPSKSSTVTRAHPRLRGADNLRSHDAVRDMGSSPLTRGGPGLDWLCAGLFRLIPAYAGRTCLYSAAVMPWAAHPRLRGADLPIDYDLFGRTGSSPLTRGGRAGFKGTAHEIGLIPAYAGRTRAIGYVRDLIEAHPRLRGADNLTSVVAGSMMGSSPLTRGGRPNLGIQQCRVGLIPAYAGRTGPCVWSAQCGRAHPRLRGADQLEKYLRAGQ